MIMNVTSAMMAMPYQVCSKKKVCVCVCRVVGWGVICRTDFVRVKDIFRSIDLF